MMTSSLDLDGVERNDVQRDTRAHGLAHRSGLDVLTLRRRRLGPKHSLNQAGGVLDQLISGEAQLADR